MSVDVFTQLWSPRPAWMQNASCRGLNPDLFFPERGAATAEARAICATCPVMVECRDMAVDNREVHGIWGNTSPRQRRNGGMGVEPRGPRPISHGTYGGYATHRRRGEPACPECVHAHRMYVAGKKAS